MHSSDMWPHGVLIKLAAVYLLAWVGLVADFSVFDTNSGTNLLLASVVIVGTAFITIRSRATKNWHDEADAANARLDTVREELRVQRELKHDAIARAAALELKTDLTPVLEHLTTVQQTLVELLARSTHTETLGRLGDITVMLEQQNELLRQIARNGGTK